MKDCADCVSVTKGATSALFYAGRSDVSYKTRIIHVQTMSVEVVSVEVVGDG